MTGLRTILCCGAPAPIGRGGLSSPVISPGALSTRDALAMAPLMRLWPSVSPEVRSALEASLVSAGSAVLIERTAKERIYSLLPSVLRCKVQLLPLVRTIRGVTYTMKQIELGDDLSYLIVVQTLDAASLSVERLLGRLASYLRFKYGIEVPASALQLNLASGEPIALTYSFLELLFISITSSQRELNLFDHNKPHCGAAGPSVLRP